MNHIQKKANFLKEKILNKNNKSRKIFVGMERSLDVVDFEKYITKNKDLLNYLCGKSICLSFKNEFDLAIWLILTEGVAHNVLILPEADELRVKDVFKYLPSDIILTDHFQELENAEVIYIHNRKYNSLEPLKPCATNWILPTSGTTGVPKFVKHQVSHLCRTTKNSSKNFTWGALYSMKRMAGIQVLIQSISSDASSLVIPDLGSSIENKIDLFVKNNVNCLSATPSLWRKILMTRNFSKLKLKNITLGGELTDQNIINKLNQAFPNASIRHIYATTEAGVVFSVTDNLEGFPSSFLENKTMKPFLKVGKKNTLLVEQINPFEDYVGELKSISNEDGFIDTGDLIEIKDSRAYFIGRLSGRINIGGNLVNPEKVEKIISKKKYINTCKVHVKPSSIIGNILFCELILDRTIEDKKKFIQLLKEGLKKDLQDFEIPTVIKVVDNIRLNETGKIDRS